MSDRLNEIRERLGKATQGPWYWDVSTKMKQVLLESRASMKPIVMDFARWGMSGAAPRFYKDGLMDRVEHFATQRVAHHIGFDQFVNHPDAMLIENAPSDIAFLLAEVERLQSENEWLRSKLPF